MARTYVRTRFATLMLSVVVGSALIGTSADAQQPPDFKGRYIAAISDGDMRAYAYVDGNLGAKRGPDLLSIVSLPPATANVTGTAEVSNSVRNPVFSIAASPDGNTVFVAETHTAQEPADKKIGDLQPGTMLRAIDVRDPSSPKVMSRVEVGLRPMGVSVSPDGRTLVLATKSREKPIRFVTFFDGKFGDVTSFDPVGLTPMPELPDQGLLPHHAEWHPERDLIAVTFQLRGQVHFYSVTRDNTGAVTRIAKAGNTVVTSKWPMSGKFSPDGRFFVTNNLQWGPDVQGFYINAPPSQLTVIRLGSGESVDARHMVVGGVNLPRNAESIAFSNDGTMIATVNIGQTWIPEGQPGHTLSSLSLVTFNTETGEPRKAGTWEIEGILPEGVAFDASDRFIVAGIYEYDGPEPKASGLEFWRVKREAGRLPRLVPTGFKIPTGPGAHSLIVVN